MMDELHARFRPQFIALARRRVAAALTAVVARDHGATATIVRELHSLVGEAGLLGLDAVVPLAQTSEQKAKLLQRTRGDAEAEVLASALRELAETIDAMEQIH